MSGSIATDQLMTFPGRFAEALLPESLAHLSVVFLVDAMQIRRGGVAANIAYGMSRLGQRPLLVGSIGEDGRDYVASLAEGGVDTSAVSVSTERHTARFVCTTDQDLNQLAAFYPGAMAEASATRLADLGQLDLVMISPNDLAAMLAQTAEAAALGIATIADPSQQIPSLAPEALRALLNGPQLLFTNEYEAELLETKTGWSAAEILDRVGMRVTTRGAEGVLLRRRDEADLTVPVVPTTGAVDPTGVGDAFRAGWLSAHANRMPLQRCLELGTLLATLCLEAVGPQGWSLEGDGASVALQRLASAHGDDAARDLEPLLAP